MTIRDAYAYGITKLSESGIVDAKTDARLLMEYLCHVSMNDILVHGERTIDEPIAQLYMLYIEKRASHIPLQHLTHEQEFMGMTFYVNEDVLIPRQDTEILVEEVMKLRMTGARILDLCTGSGCILLSLLKYMNSCIGDGVDISSKALEVAKRNAQDLQLSGADFFCGDLYEPVRDKKYDIIVSNPPYIIRKEIDHLMEEVALYDPYIALDGGEDGLDFYRRIIGGAREMLLPQGSVYLEIGYNQGADVKSIFEANGFTEIEIVKDYAGLDRVVCAK